MEKVLISGIMLATLGHRAGETLQNKKEVSDVKSVSRKIQSQVCSVMLFSEMKLEA